MSLQPDARKKIELVLQQGDTHTDKATQPPEKLNIDALPAHNAPQQKQDGPAHPTRHTKKRLGIIPIAIISGLLIAAGGSYYVWCEISSPPMQRTAALTLPLANAAPPAAQVAQTPVAPKISTAPKKNVPAEKPISQTVSSTKPNDLVPKVDAPPTPPSVPPDTATLPIRIEHGQKSDVIDPVLLAAWQAYRNGDFEAARLRYGEVLRMDAQNRNTPNRDALLGMAAIALQQSQDTIAARYYNQVLMLDPRDPVANAGISALETGDATAMESRLKLLLAQQPTGAQSASLYFALGNLYAEQSRWSDAQQTYFNACKLEQDNAQLYFNLAVSLDHMGQSKLAAQHYQHALQLEPSDYPGINRAQTQQRINELTAP